MQRRKSPRHVRAANARWRAAEARAAFERDEGLPDLPMPTDARRPIPLPLKSAGWRDVTLDPRAGFIAWRVIDDETSEVLHCAALKESIRWCARQVPRELAARNFQ